MKEIDDIGGTRSGNHPSKLGMRSSSAPGPAGSLAARQLALAGLQTLLVDAKQFPREKVCGGYLNSRALESLRQAGLSTRCGSDCESQVTAIGIDSRSSKNSFSTSTRSRDLSHDIRRGASGRGRECGSEGSNGSASDGRTRG